MQSLLARSEISLFQLSDAAIKLFHSNKTIYDKAASLIVNSFYDIFFNNKQDILGINYRLKSENSMREKIIRRKFYKSGESPEDVLNAIPDIIGIMVQCEFIQKEKLLFEVLESQFLQKHNNGYYYNSSYPNIFIDLDMPQPIIQKNGNELYKLDCFYLIDGFKVNFELQVKSLVNSFWSEVEHNIVYKNNYYLPNDDYVKEMMDSVRMNLLGLDKILSLLSGRINALNSYTVMKDLELNESLAMQLISDLLNEKMFASLGFTVNVKTIRDLLTAILLKKVKRLGTEEAFYHYLSRFRTLLAQDICFKKEILLENEYQSDSQFKNTLGQNLLIKMNNDFEWHSFFIMLFQIEECNKAESFDLFLSEVEKVYLHYNLFERLYRNLPFREAKQIQQDTGLVVAQALCEISEYGIQTIAYYNKGIEQLQGFLQYTLNCTDSLLQWKEKRDAFASVVRKIITNA